MPDMEQLPESVVASVSDAVDASTDELIGFLQDLVRIKSVNPELADSSPTGETDVQDFLVPVLEELGCEIDRWDALPGRPDQVGTIRGTGGGRSLAVNGHVDVVPEGDPNDWPYDPWAAEIADGKVWGRGALDMKGGIAAMIHAAKILQRLGYRLKGDLFIETVIDEETGGPGTLSTIQRGYRPDFAIVAEPSGLDVMPVEGGLEWVRVSVTGQSEHAAMRFESIHAGGQGKSVNAIEKGAKILAAIGELEREWAVNKVHPLVPDGLTTISPGVMAAGSGRGEDGLPLVMSAIANIPDYCVMDFDLKYLPSEKTEDVRAEFEDYIARVAQGDSWLREHPPQVEWGVSGVSFPPADTPLDHPGMETLLDCISHVRDGAEAIGMVAVTDMAWFAGEGIPSTIFGPGHASGAHSVNENIDIDQLIDGTKIMALMMLAWCGYEQS